MRISDWSSDVRSSDLAGRYFERGAHFRRDRPRKLGQPIAQRTGNDAQARRPFRRRSPHPVAAIEGRARSGYGTLHIGDACLRDLGDALRSEEHTSELQSLMRISYAVFCLKQKNTTHTTTTQYSHTTNLP